MGENPRSKRRQTQEPAPPARPASSPQPQAVMTDTQFRAEIWRALIIVVYAFVKRYGFRPPRID